MEYVLTGRHIDAGMARLLGARQQSRRQRRLPERGGGAGADDRRAAADRDPARQAGGAHRRGAGAQRRAQGRAPDVREAMATEDRVEGMQRLPREARAGLQGPVRSPASASSAPARWARHRPGGGAGRLQTRSTTLPRRPRTGIARLGEALGKGAARGRWSEAEAERRRARSAGRRAWPSWPAATW